MGGNTHTAGMEIVWTDVLTNNVDRDVISYTEDSLTLMLGLSINTNLWNVAYTFWVNFQITEMASGKRFNHYWNAPLNALPKFSSLWFSYSFSHASNAGIRTAPYSFSAQSGDGMYLYRPYMTILVPGTPDYEFFLSNGSSEFAVGEEHFIFCEVMN